ncbi:MAG: glycosyltransferase [Natronohydrobacter sp.]|nr:glycosyltransferase [Natronohydrobacter sp.]
MSVQATDQISIGVVIRTKDRPIFVTRALASVEAQTHGNWKIVLVNDGGDAQMLAQAIASQAKALQASKRLTVINFLPGIGRSAAFNRGVEALDTEFVACLDDDDTWAADFMSSLAGFYRQTQDLVSDLGGVAAQVTALKEEFCDIDGIRDIRIIGEDSLPPSFQRNEFFVNPLAYACYRQDLYPVQWILRREAVLSVGGFPEHFDVMEDRAFMNGFLARYRVAVLDRKLAFHHRRVARSDDRARNVLMNTLDNPSYDWRLFADLARPGFDLAGRADTAGPMRSFAADLLSELNYETSAIWQKVDGEMRSLKERLDRDKAETQAVISAIMAELASPPQPVPAQSLQDVAVPVRPLVANPLFDIWAALPETEFCRHLQPGHRFADRLELSRATPEDGLLMHASRSLEKFQIQFPDTRDWSAIEVHLDGLAAPGQGLRVHLQLASPDGYLFETALVCQDKQASGAPKFRLSDFEVHACARKEGCLVTREVSAAWLAQASTPKLSIILPRQARNFRFICNNLLVERA